MPDGTCRHRHKRLIPSSLALAACALLSGCFTTLLWGGDVSGDDNVHAFSRSYTEASLERAGRENRGHALPLWQRLVLTPIAVALDLLTLPIQGAISDSDDDGSSRR